MRSATRTPLRTVKPIDLMRWLVRLVTPPGGTVLDIVPDSDRLVIEGRLQPNQIEALKPGMPAKVWLTALSWREQRPLPARLAWVSADSVEDPRTGQPYFIARVELDQRPSDGARQVVLHPGMRAEMWVKIMSAQPWCATKR